MTVSATAAHLSRVPHAVEGAFGLLEAIAAHGGTATRRDLAKASSLPPASLSRLLSTCLHLGFIHHLPSGHYGLGGRLMRLGDTAIWQLAPTARPRLADLVRQSGESATVTLLDGDTAVCVAEQSARHTLRTGAEVGSRTSLHSTAAGKAILATLPDEQIRRLLQRTGMPASTPHTHRNTDDLLAELAAIRRTGYALDDQEHQIGACSCAVAIPQSPVPMAVAVSGPVSRVDAVCGDRAVAALRQVSVQLGADLSS